MNSETLTITLDCRLLERPDARHIRTMRASIWLYLKLLATLPPGGTTVEVDPQSIAARMGLPEGTIRSWLGHLRKARYIDVERLNGAVRVTIRGREDCRTEILPASEPVTAPSPPIAPRAFTAGGLARTLGERGDPAALMNVIETYPDDVIRTALAKTLAVPARDIRRSRTALFLYLLKQRHEKTDHPRS